MNTSLQSIVAQLLDSGNLVLKDSSKYVSGNYIWQSFDHPSDTLLAGMKFGWDLRMGLDRHMTSWKSTEDPSTGDFTYGVDLRGIIPQFIVHKGHAKYYRTGPWNRIQFSGVQMTPNLIFTPKFVDNSWEVYYTFKAFNESTIMRLELNSYGNVQRAYANIDAMGGGSGCLLWFVDLLDVRKLSEYANINCCVFWFACQESRSGFESQSSRNLSFL
ncbi:S-locus-specific glycoprotein S6-like [Eucalyptus grandis]|uniref:S-locus-specific glycoprotein S6-like n=1 Tax=Eucalyptus grandis TaxID=71139 RepID=UPI0008A0B0D7|nr:S-locus-specific glycoprotein S6-like [Eucalyptus grandis]